MNSKTDIKKYLFVMCQTQKTVFDHFSNTKKIVENTKHSGVFLTNFKVFGKLVKYCHKCLIKYLLT